MNILIILMIIFAVCLLIKVVDVIEKEEKCINDYYEKRRIYQKQLEEIELISRMRNMGYKK